MEKRSSATFSSAWEIDVGAPLTGRGMREGIELRDAAILDNRDADVLVGVEEVVSLMILLKRVREMMLIDL